jgi:SAM-dependent methyltransferase
MRREAPAAARNRQPILDVLQQHLPRHGLVLEIASGTGEHTAHFASALPQLTFQPSDPDAGARASIDDWGRTLGLANVRRALALDAATGPWPIERADAILCINMIHISPWAATLGLMTGAALLLPPGGLLYLYGPYHRDGKPTAPSNEAFDLDLRRRNSTWGIRDLEEVTSLAATHGFAAPTVVEMPTNNLSLIFKRHTDVTGSPGQAD